MRFQPKTEEEIATAGLLDKGNYDYEVVKAEEQVSKGGNDMIKLTLHIFDGESERVLFDYLLEAMPGKLKHFCDQHGMQDQYSNGTLRTSDCEGKMGKVEIGIKKDKSGQYPDQNNVRDYVVTEKLVSQPKQRVPAAAPPSNNFVGVTDDDVPF